PAIYRRRRQDVDRAAGVRRNAPGSVRLQDRAGEDVGLAEIPRGIGIGFVARVRRRIAEARRVLERNAIGVDGVAVVQRRRLPERIAAVEAMQVARVAMECAAPAVTVTGGEAVQERVGPAVVVLRVARSAGVVLVLDRLIEDLGESGW